MERKKLNELLKVVGISSNDQRLIHHITCRSFQAGKDDLFVAMEGKQTSGYVFCEEVKKKGALVMTERMDPTCFQVEDCREAYALLLHAFYGQPCLKLKMIGVTGTNGKSTTAALIKEMLEAQAFCCAMIGTSGIDLKDVHMDTDNTTPDSELIVTALDACIKQSIDYVVMEVSSMALAQKRVSGCLFDVMIFTNIAQDHVEEHGSLQQYIASKQMAMELIKPQGVMIYNQDDPVLCDFARQCRHFKLSFGKNSGQFQISHLQESLQNTTFDLNGKPMNIPLVSWMNAYNCTAAIAAGFALDLCWSKIMQWTSRCHGIAGRFERVWDEPCIVIDYAHTEKAMQELLRYYRTFCKGKLFVVFGCGGNRDRGKRSKMGQAAAEYSDQIILTNDNPRSEDPLAIIKDIQKGCDGQEWVIPNRFEAIKKAIDSAQKNDIIIVVGKGNEKTQQTNGITRNLNDKQIVLSILKGEEH